jgi:hypothetical protein
MPARRAGSKGSFDMGIYRGSVCRMLALLLLGLTWCGLLAGCGKKDNPPSGSAATGSSGVISRKGNQAGTTK